VLGRVGLRPASNMLGLLYSAITKRT
jgi:hypothetical protein